ncbi:hypothetical protein FRACYDRAFT_244063 [Fragilariopsis cylindrus CCMP1102]|uniref:Uncharacterized protein n=1 Tax=Fragilariopsis cylindrus CCMP1102 TaxID=635003 RepID=A0A1E7F3S1_9STRA|nr:hypothetical protein FRACYDRAFT_244063 [Fragilariopsis cylindrus CCMP1102]|eukprot:OEU12789.1 hypothetical protein FRACYDRAFT_244063 [Fragilariopsis cylindrus CCMP1102]
MCRLNPKNKDKAPVTADAMTAIASSTLRNKQVVGIRSTTSKQSSFSSWIWLYHFITASFHGNLGMISFFITFTAFIITWCTSSLSSSSNSQSNSSIFVGLSFIIVSIITTTILSIHSSYYMLNQSPYSSTILDYDFNVNLNRLLPSSSLALVGRFINKKRNYRASKFNIKVVPPHRDAFNRTSIIMQYANSRILLLLHRQYYNNQEQNNQDSSSSSTTFSRISISGIIVWTLVLFGCIRMLPIHIPDMFSSSPAAGDDDNDTNPDDELLSKNRLTKKTNMPTFWYNGNTYCFVLPMMISLIGDFIMTIYCEYHYHYHYHYFHDENNQTPSSSSSLSLYDYHTKYWLSISHLLFLQLIAHIIAFSFTLIFRIRDKNKNKKSNSNKKSGNMSTMSTIFNIRTLYWVCTIGVYALVIIGFSKVIKTFQSLHNNI